MTNQKNDINIVKFKDILENFLNSFPKYERVNFDPLFFPRYAYENFDPRNYLKLYNNIENLRLQCVESVAITSAFLAFGNVKAFMKTLNNIFTHATKVYNIKLNANKLSSPYCNKENNNILYSNNNFDNLTSNYNSPQLNSEKVDFRINKNNFQKFEIFKLDKDFAYKFFRVITLNKDLDFNTYYRFCSKEEINTFFKILGIFYSKYNSFYNVFYEFYIKSKNIHFIICKIYDIILNEFISNGLPLSKGIKHLISNPYNYGTCKRWLLFFRWMIRPNDGIDLGLWQNIEPSILVIPVDKHISRISRLLGFTNRKTDDWQTAVEITNNLKKFDPNDPIKYDFALCHLGISRFCCKTINNDFEQKFCEELSNSNCAKCLIRDLCKNLK